MKTRTDDEMDELALKLGAVVDGECLFDVCRVCARMIAYSVYEMADNDPKRIFLMAKMVSCIEQDFAERLKIGDLDDDEEEA